MDTQVKSVGNDSQKVLKNECPAGAPAAMSRDEFWAIIEESKRLCGKKRSHEWYLADLLYNLDKEQLRSFDDHWYAAHHEAYRWDLLAVSAILGYGTSDSRFDHFRFWLIAQGRSVFETVLADPERLIEFINPWHPVSGEEFAHAEFSVMRQVFSDEELFGNDDDVEVNVTSNDPVGTRWEWKDLPQMYPELCKKVGWDDFG